MRRECAFYRVTCAVGSRISTAGILLHHPTFPRHRGSNDPASSADNSGEGLNVAWYDLADEPVTTTTTTSSSKTSSQHSVLILRWHRRLLYFIHRNWLFRPQAANERAGRQAGGRADGRADGRARSQSGRQASRQAGRPTTEDEGGEKKGYRQNTSPTATRKSAKDVRTARVRY